jgi:hypothetical protein
LDDHQPGASRTREHVGALLEARARALRDGDATSLAALLHPGFRYVDSLGRELERAAYLESRGSGEIVFARHEVRETRIEVLEPGRVAIATCIVDDEGEYRGERFTSRSRAVHLLVCEGERWVFLFGQSTAITDVA